MKKVITISLSLFFFHAFYGQVSCFDAANKYRFHYLNQNNISFDSLTFYLVKGENMLIDCTFPNDTFTNIKNIHYSVDDFKDKVLIIDFWSIYCAPCINEIPSFHALQKKYGEQITVLAFTLDSPKEITGYLKNHRFEAEIIADAREFVKKYSLGSGYPFSLLIDKNRKIIHVKSGGKADPESKMDLYNEFYPLIDEAIKQK